MARNNSLLRTLVGLPTWRVVLATDILLAAYKEADYEKERFPSSVRSIAAHTTDYEDLLRVLWEEYKNNPSEANAVALIKALKEHSENAWELLAAELFGIDAEELTDAHRRFIIKDLNEHHGFLEGSFLPDLLKATREGSPLESMDHRLIFMYSGALWAFGFLATVTFDGLNLRDLADVFLFAGPDDEDTCTGPRGCKTYANKLLTVAEILANNIRPGKMRCYTNCRHILIPITSPLL